MAKTKTKNRDNIQILDDIIKNTLLSLEQLLEEPIANKETIAVKEALLQSSLVTRSNLLQLIKKETESYRESATIARLSQEEPTKIESIVLFYLLTLIAAFLTGLLVSDLRNRK